MTRESVRLAVLLMAALLSLSLPVVAAPGGFSAKEDDQIKILQSDAKPGEKGLACKRLAIVGTEKCVSAVAPLLSDPQLASWARIPLEAIPGTAADDALRNAAGTLKGRLLVGVINSIAVRLDAKAVPLLVQKLEDADGEVASASAAALGRIGGNVAAKALLSRLNELRPDVRETIAEGCILIAEAQLASGKKPDAERTYLSVVGADVSKQKKREARRGTVLAATTAASRSVILAALFESADADEFALGLQTVRELSEPVFGKALASAMEKTTPARKPYLLLAMADRGDKEALPIALKAVGDADAGLRAHAIMVLGRLGDPSAAETLLAAALDENASVKKAAEEALRFLSGDAVESAVRDMLKSQDPARRLLAVNQCAERQMPGAVATLLGAAKDADEKVRVVAVKSLGAFAGVGELPAVLGLLLKSKSSAEIRAAENAVTTICMRSAKEVSGQIAIKKAVYGDLPDGSQKDVTKKVAAMVKSGNVAIAASNGNFGDPAGGTVKRMRIVYTVNGATRSQTVTENDTLTLAVREVSPACIDAVMGSLAKAAGKPKLALLRVLQAVGGQRALKAVHDAVSDSDADVARTASRALCEWPDSAALVHLEPMAKSSTDMTLRILALRGCIRLFDQGGKPTEERVAGLKRAAALATRPEEKRLVLAAIGNVSTPEALALVTPYLADAEVKEEACVAVLGIVDGMKGRRSEAAMKAVKSVAEVTKNPKTAQRARALAGKG